jgi:hypothetical protein
MDSLFLVLISEIMSARSPPFSELPVERVSIFSSMLLFLDDDDDPLLPSFLVGLLSSEEASSTFFSNWRGIPSSIVS